MKNEDSVHTQRRSTDKLPWAVLLQIRGADPFAHKRLMLIGIGSEYCIWEHGNGIGPDSMSGTYLGEIHATKRRASTLTANRIHNTVVQK